MKRQRAARERPICFTLFRLINRACLESRSALLRFIGADIAGDHGVIVALQREFAVACNRVIGGELKNGQGIQHNAIIGIVVDGIPAQAIQQGTQINQDSSAGVAGDVDSSVQVGVRMVGNLDSAFAIAVDFGYARPFAMAGFAAVHANPGIGWDGSISHDDGAGVDHFQSKRALVSDDAVVAIDISFRAVGHSHSHACIIADHIFRAGGNLIAAVQDQMAGQHADASASIVCYRGAGLGAIHIESSAAYADAGARAVFDCAIGNVHQ